MDVLTSYLPVTDKFRSITEKDILLQSVKKFIKSRWPELGLHQHADWSQLEGSTDAESPSGPSKDVFCSGNMWLFQPRCGLKFSNSFTKDNRDPTNEVTRAQIRVLAGH
jgi:hypothetical protein